MGLSTGGCLRRDKNAAARDADDADVLVDDDDVDGDNVDDEVDLGFTTVSSS